MAGPTENRIRGRKRTGEHDHAVVTQDVHFLDLGQAHVAVPDKQASVAKRTVNPVRVNAVAFEVSERDTMVMIASASHD